MNTRHETLNMFLTSTTSNSKTSEKKELKNNVQEIKKRKTPILNTIEAKNLQLSFFKAIPTSVLANTLTPCLDNDMQSLSSLITSCKGLRPFFQPALNDIKTTLSKLAQHVVYGEKEKLEQKLETLKSDLVLLKQLLCCRIRVIDYSGRTIEGTLYELALGADDTSREAFPKEGIANLIATYLILCPNGESERIKQINRQFPPGWQQEQAKEEKEDIAAFNKLIECIKNAKETKEISDEALSLLENECHNALSEFRNYCNYKLNKIIKTGKHFNVKIFQEANKFFQDNFKDVSWNVKQILFLQKVLGFLQRFVPACLAQASCQGEDLFVDNNGHGQELKRSFDTSYLPNTPSFYPLAPLNSDNRLGFEWFHVQMLEILEKWVESRNENFSNILSCKVDKPICKSQA